MSVEGKQQGKQTAVSRGHQERMEAGMCRLCGKPRGANGTSQMCRLCADKAREAVRARLNRRKEAGRCTQCGRKRGRGGTRWFCRKCANLHTERQLAYYHAKKAAASPAIPKPTTHPTQHPRQTGEPAAGKGMVR